MKPRTQPFFTFLLTLLCSAGVYAQVPQAFHYQAVARDGSGQILANRTISVRIGILKGSATGSALYTETHQVTTNEAGSFTLEVGHGTQVGSSPFTSVDWLTDHYYLSIGIDR